MTEAQEWFWFLVAVPRSTLFWLFFFGFLAGGWIAWNLTELHRDYLERKGKE